MKPKLHSVSRQIPSLTCPECKELLDGCTGIGDEGEILIPCDGDNTTCAYCGHFLQFTKSGLAYGTQEQLDTLPPDLRAVVERVIKQPIRIKE